MKALRLVEWERDPELLDVPAPEPGPGEVLLRVGGAGACHSDLHIMEWKAGTIPWRTPLPFTMGHENAGWIEQLGAGVGGFSVGDPVAVYGHWGCGRCQPCREGRENHCENSATYNDAAEGGGLGLDGGMAEYMLVPAARYLIPLDRLQPREAAPLTDAGLTPYHAVKRSLHLLGAGSSAAVIGVGGLGHMAVQILKAVSGAGVIAVDVSEDKLRLAREAGADHGVLSGPDARTEIREIAKGRGVQLVLDFVGSDATIELGMGIASVVSSVTILGIARGVLPWTYFKVPYEASLAVSYWGSISDLMEVIKLAEAGHIASHNSYYTLDQHAEVYAALRAGEVLGRAVFTPHSGP